METNLKAKMASASGVRSDVQNGGSSAQQAQIRPKVGLVGLSHPQEKLFEECFKQFGIQTATLRMEDAPRLEREKFEGIVLSSGGAAEEILQAARHSSSNHRLMIFAVCKHTKDVLSYAQYGINVTIAEPLERQEVLKAVRSTYLLIVNEYRRYLRIPMVVPVGLLIGTNVYKGSTCEISGGGMSMLIPSARVHLDQACTVSFTLSGLQTLHLEASVRWIRETAQVVGVKFFQGQAGCAHVKKWVDEYLGIK